MSRIDRTFPGHFLGSADCEFFRTTDCFVSVRNNLGAVRVRVSTVGLYKPTLPKVSACIGRSGGWVGEYMEVGYNRLFETMVFNLGVTICGCGCGAPEVDEWSELDAAGYNTAEDAEAGHEAMVRKYTRSTR